MMRCLVPLIVALLSLACGEPASPSPSLQPPTGAPLPTGVPNGAPLTMRGEVWERCLPRVYWGM
jgi:hypothetical protein